MISENELTHFRHFGRRRMGTYLCPSYMGKLYYPENRLRHPLIEAWAEDGMTGTQRFRASGGCCYVLFLATDSQF